MAFGSIVQHGTNSGTGSSGTLTMTAPSSPVIICVGVSSGSTSRVSSITQTGVTWTRVDQSALTNVECEIWVGTITGTPGTTATINYATSVTWVAQFMEISGIANSSPTDVNANRTATNPSLLSGSITTTVANDFLVSALVVSDTSSISAASNSFTIEDSIGTGINLQIVVSYRVVSATGTYNTTLSWDAAPGSWNMANAIAGFKKSSVVVSQCPGSFGF